MKTLTLICAVLLPLLVASALPKRLPFTVRVGEKPFMGLVKNRKAVAVLVTQTSAYDSTLEINKAFATFAELLTNSSLLDEQKKGEYVTHKRLLAIEYDAAESDVETLRSRFGADRAELPVFGVLQKDDGWRFERMVEAKSMTPISMLRWVSLTTGVHLHIPGAHHADLEWVHQQMNRFCGHVLTGNSDGLFAVAKSVSDNLDHVINKLPRVDARVAEFHGFALDRMARAIQGCDECNEEGSSAMIRVAIGVVEELERELVGDVDEVTVLHWIKFRLVHGRHVIPRYVRTRGSSDEL